MHQQAYGNVEITKVDDVAILPGALGIESQPIARYSRQVTQQEVALGAGRKSPRMLNYGRRNVNHGAVPVVPSITDSEECNKKKIACAHLHFRQ
jgi:hypothetical protein